MGSFLEKLIPPRPWMPSILSAVVIVSALGMYAQLLWFGNPKALDDVILGRILGTLDTAFGLVLAYWIGSTRSSHDKDETIREMAYQKDPNERS